MIAKQRTVALPDGSTVSALWQKPKDARAVLVLAHAAVRAGIAHAGKLAGDLPLFAGGRSFGARMTSQAQALDPLPGVAGLVFFAWPLHPPGKAGIERAEHLAAVKVPMLFLQGSKDEFAETPLLQSTVKSLGKRAKLHLVEHADHSFHVPAKSGRKDVEVMEEILGAAVKWMDAQT